MIGRDLVGRHLFENGHGMPVEFEPRLGRLPVRGEMDYVMRGSGSIKDPDRSDRRALDHGEGERAVDAECSQDGDDDRAAAADITFMQGEGRLRGIAAKGSRVLFPDQTA